MSEYGGIKMPAETRARLYSAEIQKHDSYWDRTTCVYMDIQNECVTYSRFFEFATSGLIVPINCISYFHTKQSVDVLNLDFSSNHVGTSAVATSGLQQ